MTVSYHPELLFILVMRYKSIYLHIRVTSARKSTLSSLQIQAYLPWTAATKYIVIRKNIKTVDFAMKSVVA